MAVDALELRPRTAVALFDAALRLCARSTGVWSITLPAGAAMVAATFSLAEAIEHHRAVLWPSLALTAAWLFRGICQGAAAHYLERQLLEPTEPSTWGSFVAALKHAPALIWASGYCFAINSAIYALSGGLGFLFIPSHLVAYAVAMKGRGSLWALYDTCSKMLGGARSNATWLRLFGLVQVLIILNLHLAVAVLLMAARQLLALDVTFVDRFASLDNGVWVAAVAATGYSLFEPVRAASATLLLVDGRVRQEGLDLLAQLEQLPRRRTNKSGAAAVFIAALGLTVLAPGLARAQDDWSGTYVPGAAAEDSQSTAMSERLRAAFDECGLGQRVSEEQLQAADRQSAQAPAAMTRFVVRIERFAFDDEACDQVEAEGLAGLEALLRADAAFADTSARDDAAAILARPEFGTDPEAEKPPDSEKNWFQKWWDEVWESFVRWLRSHDRQRESSVSVPTGGSSLGLSSLVVVLAVVLVIGLLAYLLLRNTNSPRPAEETGDQMRLTETPLGADPMNALTRAPESWAGLADQLAQEGRFREAIRHLYLALLSKLHREGAIDYDPAKSNWDYFRGFKGSLDLLQPFRELTRRFDFAWYGNLEVSGDAYQTFRTITRPLLQGPLHASGA